MMVGYAPVDFEEWAEPSTRAAFKAALDVLKTLGVQMKEIEIPDFPYSALTGTIVNGEAGSIFEELIRSGQVDQLADKRQAAGLKASLEVSAHEYLRAMRVRTLVQEKFRDVFSGVDMLLAPSRNTIASKVTEPPIAPRAHPRNRAG